MGELGAHIGTPHILGAYIAEEKTEVSVGTDTQPWCTYAQKHTQGHIHLGWYTDTFTHSLTPRSVSTAQLCCGRPEDCDDVKARRRWRLLPGSFLMVELTFTLGGCGLWLLLTEK